MASTVARVPAKDMMNHITLQVEITGSIYGPFEWRRRVAFALMRVSAWVLRMQIEIKA